MRNLLITCLLAAAAAAGCGGSSTPPPAQPIANTPPPPPPVDAPPPSTVAVAKAKMTYFTDAMCKCKDTACAQRVADDMTKWGEEMAKQEKDPPKLTDQDTKEFTEIGQRMGTCMQTAMGAGSGSP